MPFSLTDLLLLVVVIAFLYWVTKKAPHSLPPGPKGWPIVGNLLDIPKENFYKKYSEWAQMYGSIVYANAAGQPIIILSDMEVVNEMLDRKGAIYSDRPILHMAGELAGFDKWTGGLAYGLRWRESRKYMHNAIGTRESLEGFGALFESEIRRFLKATLHDPDNLKHHVRHAAGSIIVRIAYGYETREKDDPIIALADAAMRHFKRLRDPGTYMVDFIPPLKYVPAWFPGANFKKIASDVRRALYENAEVPFQFSIQEMARGATQASVISKNMQSTPMTDVDKDRLKWSASSLFSGGSDTTVSTLSNFYLTMTLFPEIQRQAQEELDEVTGGIRLPTLADRDRTPYVCALLSELYRWNPVVKTGFPHRATEADIHRGYYIPKGTIIVPNIWQMLHDPQVYPDPEVFSPERFLEINGKTPQRNPRACAFGFGRRICPGVQFTDTTVWLAIAMTLSVFQISKVTDENPDIMSDKSKTSNLTSPPKEFECRIVPRSARAEELIFQSL